MPCVSSTVGFELIFDLIFWASRGCPTCLLVPATLRELKWLCLEKKKFSLAPKSWTERANAGHSCACLKKQGFAPKLLVTDKLRSYASAFRRLGLTWPHKQGIHKNNRAENSHPDPHRENSAPMLPRSGKAL